MANSRTCGSTGSTIYYTLCKIGGYLPTNGCTPIVIMRVAVQVQVVIMPTKNDQ